jgi:acetolactate synthase-1/2/3 large subunit
MTGCELAVALERKLSLKVIVAENNIHGSIPIHQERGYPGRIVGTAFVNTDLELIGKVNDCAVTRISTRAEVN